MYSSNICIFTKSNVYHRVSLTMCIRGKIEHTTTLAIFLWPSALGLFAFNYDSHKMAVIPY